MGGLIGFIYSTMTTNEITAAARRKVLETSTDILSDTTVLLYANQAYIEVYKRVFTSNEVATETVACTNGVCVLPTTYGRMYTVAEDNDQNFYTEVSIADYLKTERTDVYTIENGTILVKNEEASTLTVKFYAQPETLTASQNPTIDPYFHECIVYGTVWRLHEELQDEELSEYYQNKFETELTRRMSSQSTYEEANQSGGEMFTYQSLI